MAASACQLTFSPSRALPAGRDGKQIAFGAGFKNYLISANGGTPQQLPSPDATVVTLNWSPDGNSLVLWSSPGFPVSHKFSVHIVDCEEQGVRSCPDRKDFFPALVHRTAAILQRSQAKIKTMLFDFKTQKWLELVTFPPAFQTGHGTGNIFISTLSEMMRHFIACASVTTS